MLATRLDSEWRIPCGRQHGLTVGVDSVLAMVPVVGSLALLGISGHVVHFGYSMGLPRWRVSVMTWNAAVETILGEVPLLGPLLTSLYKGNRRNVNHILRHFGRLQRPGQARVPAGASGQGHGQGQGQQVASGTGELALHSDSTAAAAAAEGDGRHEAAPMASS